MPPTDNAANTNDRSQEFAASRPGLKELLILIAILAGVAMIV